MAMNRHHLPGSAEDLASRPVTRKRGRDSERVRVTRACDRCKRRKIKCNGIQPCEFCSRAKASCTFDSAYVRGRVPFIPSAPDAEAGAGGTSTPAPAEAMITAAAKDPSGFPGQHYAAAPGTEPATQPSAGDVQGIDLSLGYIAESDPNYAAMSSSSSRDPSEPSQTDLEGHYVGPASGVSFLLRIQKRLRQAISFAHPSSIFTFGDAPLKSSGFDPSFCMMLARDDAQRLVDRYFDFAMPTYRFLHRPTVQKWFTEFYDTLGVMHNSQSAPAKVALLFMVFAQARVYMPDSDRPGPPDLSARFYFAAEHHLTKETGSIRLTSVQARLTQCYYLLTQSRINHCWSLFGTVTSLVLALGLNRNRHPDATSGSSYVEVECRRRTFWCAYTLDAYLSAALGRPRLFHDEDIDTELPACVDDHEITETGIRPSTVDASPSIMLAPLAHIKLARISSKILRGLYSVKPISASRRAALTGSISNDLREWRAGLARFLDADAFSASLLMPIFQRQRNVLNLTYWHAIILAHRPFVLSNFAQLSQQPSWGGAHPASRQNDESVQKCLVAAMSTVKTIDDITRNHQMFRSFWITAYFAFNAVILLYIYVIQERESPPDVYNEYLAAAARCQAHLAGIAEKGSLSERYCLVLEELRVEALRQTKHTQPSLAGVPGIEDASGYPNPSMPTDESPLAVASNYSGPMAGGAAIDLNGMPVAALADNSGWDQFFSMVSSGLGTIDVPSMTGGSGSVFDPQQPSFP
ncbi:Transcription factor [Niveomyces insectorum RCEF 264]|uniref:Transcription factor n=1 Tax=Niveomyces insectorum RCEF 264 TaxID=1081102 RepID=A0A167X5Z8_9HYPO|nr:Transcription factor [Niveomyces insectorum RCEF 264]